jgi:hypothetical protein
MTKRLSRYDQAQNPPDNGQRQTEPEDDLVVNARRGYHTGWSFTPLNGKVPFLKNWPERKRPSMKEIRSWVSEGLNLGLCTGQASGGIVVIDFDPNEEIIDVDERKAELKERIAKWNLPRTVTVITGRGGRHFYYHTSERLSNSAGKLGDHIDFKAEGGQVVFPGSVHPDTSRAYRWAKGCSPEAIEVAELPQSIVAKLKVPKPRQRLDNSILGGPIPEGKRNATLTSLAGVMRSKGMGLLGIKAALLAENRRCQPPLPEDEVVRIAENVVRYEPGTTRGIGSVDFKLMTLSELIKADVAVEYLIEGVLVAKQPILLAGPVKSLKTSILLDLCLSLVTGCYFLGKFNVLRKIPVAVLSGESGLPVIKETLRRIARARGIDPVRVTNLVISDRVPRLSNPAHLDTIRQMILDHKLELLAIDPAYLALDGENAANVMVFGQQLKNVSELCQEMGVALLLCHHTKKASATDYNPINLTDAAWAGFAEHCRQWILVNHRERFDPDTGTFRLWLGVGGSAGHSGLYAVDVDQGHLDDPEGRRWIATVDTTTDAKNKASDRRVEQRLDEDKRRVMRAIALLEEEHPEGNSQSTIRERAGLSITRFKNAMSAVVDEGRVECCGIRRSNWTTPIGGFKMVKGVKA